MPPRPRSTRPPDAGVKVIAYDRLIKTAEDRAYISFNNVEVGRQQAEGVLKAIEVDDVGVAKGNSS